MNHFELLYEGGDYCDGNRRMHVRLYPETEETQEGLRRGEQASTDLRDTCERLLAADAITFYRIETFDTAEHGYPDLDLESDIGVEFVDYLTDGDRNGTGENLMMYRGCHEFVHNQGIDTIHYADALSADDCHDDPIYDYHATAFNEANVAWSTLPRFADNTDRGRAALIHELLHTFIRANQPDVEEMICDRSGYTYYDEHTLGAIDENGDVTPLLVFHVDEHGGCCTPNTEHTGGYTTEMTTCTVDAVGYTARDQCEPQSAGCQE